MPVLVAQAGHEGRTSGKTGTAGEQVRVKRVRDRIAATAPPGWTVRCIDADEPDASYRGDVFLSVHCDGSTNPSARGASVGYPTPEGGAYAAKWKAAYSALGWPGGWHADNWTPGLRGYYAWSQCLRVGTRAAFLIELGTTTNAADAAWIDAHTEEIVASVWTALAGAGGSDSVKLLDPVPTGAVRVYRLFDPGHLHHYTTSIDEANTLLAKGWAFENRAFDLAQTNSIPVYRVLRANGKHLFTTSVAERDAQLAIPGAINEGIAFYAAPDGEPVYRFLNGDGHLLTLSKAEGEAAGLKLEGVAFHVGIVAPAPSDANEQIATLEAKLDKCTELARQILAVAG